MKKIDIHSHILPDIDDGAQNMEESLRMLRIAARQGTRAVIATPHCSMKFRNENPERIRQQCRFLESRIQKELKKKFRVYAGQEIFYEESVVDRLEKGLLLTMADSPYVLIEFHPSTAYSVIYNAVRNLTYAGYWPIIAHVERYVSVRESGRVEELREIGAALQMNYRRIGGKWYEDTTRWCRKMLKEQQIQYLGTDMHNTKERGPDTLDAEEWMMKRLDEDYIKEITYFNARSIIRYIQEKKREEKEINHG